MVSEDADCIYEMLMRAAFLFAKREFDGVIIMPIMRAGGFEVMV